MNTIKVLIIFVISIASVGLSSCGEVRTRYGILTRDDT
ncbi:hypothetical protein SDC9_88143 [bioreactor metagenome]|uniref:Uncharacterized protein n=1 Tax=bioreactor metagenome TaxID=1076179 RepID=A0A644ZM98_9ZZZZ